MNEEIELLVETTIKILNSKLANKNKIPISTMYMEFTRLLLSTIILESLAAPLPDTTKKKQLEVVKQRFGIVKLGIQEAIAIAFQDAIKAYSNADLDYVCTIRPIMEQNNKSTH